MTIKSVIFDMDGVLVETEPFHIRALKEILKEELSLDLSYEEIGEYVGITYPDKLKIIFKKRGIRKDVFELSKKIQDRYFQLIKNRIKLLSGVKTLLDKLSKGGYKIGLVTASPSIQSDMVMEGTRTRKYFDAIITGSDVKNLKPDPECYLLTTKKLNLEPEECVVIEDSVPGVIAAKNAGMKCIARPNPYIKNGDFSRADIIVDNIEEISIEMIRSFN